MPHRDLVIIPDDEPGVLARLGGAAGDAGLNILGFSAFTGQGKGIIHLLVDEPEKALEVFTGAGFDVKAMRRVVVAEVENVPGAMGAAIAKVADAGVNVEQAYLAGDTRLCMVVDDVDAAKAALGQAPDA